MCRYARVFVFCYTLALHLLIMGVLARWSHGHSQTLAATELLQAQQVCTCSALNAVHLLLFLGPNRVVCLTAVLVAIGGVGSDAVLPMKYALLRHILLWTHLLCFPNSIHLQRVVTDQIHEHFINEFAA